MVPATTAARRAAVRLGIAAPLIGMLGIALAAPPAKKALTVVKAAAPVSFNRDVRPILTEKCLSCHGFDGKKRQAGLRLDTPEGAFALLASGKKAVVAGHPEKSGVIVRMNLKADHPQVMPPVDTGKTLSRAERDTLTRWIRQGAPFEPHWAFAAPKRPAAPTVKNPKWARNTVDRFVLARLEAEGLTPSPEAPKRTLIRRVTLDLTGLPPSRAEVDAFLADTSPGAYEKVVDRLLTSPRYGEKMALPWLDLSRYADTHGYHIDSLREMWPWRDWVIDAFNKNLPYDRFIQYQIAGDLLPNATLEQKIATGFNRNHPINYEGGAIPEEYAAQYVHDRVDTTATAFLGLTMRCAQCHDHKYDPLSQKDYYRFYALFNTIAENGLDGQNGNAAPFIKAPTGQQEAKLRLATAELDAAKKQVEDRKQARQAEVTAWAQGGAGAVDTLPVGRDGLVTQVALSGDLKEAAQIVGKAEFAPGNFGAPALSFDGTQTVNLGQTLDVEKTDSFSYGAWIKPQAGDSNTVLSRMDETRDFRGWDLYLGGGGRVYVHLISKWEGDAIRVNTRQAVPMNQWSHVFATYDGSGKASGVTLYINGKRADVEITHDKLTGSIRTLDTIQTVVGRRTPGAAFKGQIADARLYSRLVPAPDVELLAGVEPTRAALAIALDKRSKEQTEQITNWYLNANDAEYRLLRGKVAELEKARADVDRTIPTVMVMQEMEKPRTTHLLLRGQYDKPGEIVTPGTPAVFPGLDKLASSPQSNRLALAEWLTSPQNPLVARVAVNRFWQNLWGHGLVRTPENFGVGGESPTHPELLDWLATEFIRTGWDVKRLQKMLVMSATYRQSSQVTPPLKSRDPENKLLARAPRLRLPAELVRDQALALGGLLSKARGGPSVRPYQPAGLWEELSINPDGFSAQRYVQDHGDALYRRSLYTFWKRTVPPPSLQTFDAPEREFCIVRRPATNTPLQALVLMNDPTYIEAARKFAERIVKEGGTSGDGRIRWAYRTALSRSPRPSEIAVFEDVVLSQLVHFGLNEDQAKRLLTVGEAPADKTQKPAELAAWTAAASVLLNLDETLTRE